MTKPLHVLCISGLSGMSQVYLAEQNAATEICTHEITQFPMCDPERLKESSKLPFYIKRVNA